MRDADALDITALIDERPISGLQYYVLGFAGVVMLLNGYDYQAMAMAVPALAGEWSVPSSAFGLPLAAHILGLALASSLIAPVADRVGRKHILVAGLVILGVSALATGLSQTPNQLSAWRLVTGLGLGMCLPILTTLVSEYAPFRCRTAMVMAVLCNMALGSFLSGITAGPLIEHFGWRMIFTSAAGAAFVLCVLTILTIPESIRFLVLRRPHNPRIAGILARLAPGIDARRLEAMELLSGGSAMALINPTYRARTAVLWTVFVLNAFVLTVMMSWLPTLLGTSGFTASQALAGAGVIQVGGIIGGFFLSWQMDKGRTILPMISIYVVAIASLLSFGFVPTDFSSWTILLLLVGSGVAGPQFALVALASGYYPPEIRASGVGWAGAVGQMGGVPGPLLGAAVLQLQMQPSTTLSLVAVPILLCAVTVPLLRPSWRVH